MSTKQPKVLVISRKSDVHIKQFFSEITEVKAKVNTNQTAEIRFDNSYAMVFICRNDLEEFRMNLQTVRDYLANEGNLIVLGDGLNQRSFNYARDFNEIIGLKPVNYHNDGGTHVYIENPEHPIMRDVEDFDLDENLIEYQQTAEFCSTLFEASGDGQSSVGAMVNPNGGRTVCIAIGRKPETWENEMFRRIISNLIEYCTCQQ